MHDRQQAHERMAALLCRRLIAFQKRDGNTYIQHLLPNLATMRDSMPRAKALGN